METVTGQEITAEGITSDQWYHVETASGSIGYVSSIYVKMESPLAAPHFLCGGRAAAHLRPGEL